MDETKIKKLFGKKIRQLRKEKNLTQEQLAEMVELDTQHLCKMENGIHFPSLKNLLKLANILECELVDMFVYDESREKNIVRKLKFNIQHKLSTKELTFVDKTISALMVMHNKF